MSAHSELEVIVEQNASSAGEILVCSPAVGMYGQAPKVGEVLMGGGLAGRLTALGTTVNLVLPKGFSGRVAERPLRNRRDPVEYGQLLLRLVPVETGLATSEPVRMEAGVAAGLPQGCFAVTSPTHGMFYRRSRPDAPPYVKVGQVVEQGATLALVEVMKCFSAITYGGEGLPHRAEIVEVRPADGAEVQFEQVLFVVRPV